ncbi:hypothetical protein GA0115255_124876 [Streptomyces sp. Ncost-T6T-2b]|nr:hypothetical protein GA0115255_124876 [Streptomyces sp. Ncost-T6T-2b]
MRGYSRRVAHALWTCLLPGIVSSQSCMSG